MFNIPLNSKPVRVLTHGFVKLIDCMPRQVPYNGMMCDSAVVQAARVSYGEGLKDKVTDSKLIHYLYKHKHTSPFEMVKFKFHVKAPIFVARQWFRHRMGNYNEISGRYSKLDFDVYKPEKFSSQSKINKQLSADDDLSDNNTIKGFIKSNDISNKHLYYNYTKLIENGVSREVARINLPLSLFTEFYFCIDLHNLMNFLKLRNSKNAQLEIKEYAKIIQNLITPLCPVTMEAYNEYKTVTLSNNQIKSLKFSTDNENANQLTKRELSELYDLFNKVN